jgi:hypothetical protein
MEFCMKLLRFLLLICMMQSFGVFAQPTQLPEKFISGDLRYECVWGCNFKFDYARNSINEIYRNKDWIGLVNKMDEFGLNSRTTYFALFRAAEELGHYEAARVYLKLAKANGLEMGCFAINKLDMCAEMSRINSITVRETALADKTISEDILKVSEISSSLQQTYLISADTKQKEKIEPIQIKADVSNQVVNLGASNNSLRRVEQPLFEKSTVAQLNVQASNVPSQILIDACKALKDLERRSECLETILKMGQSGNNPPLRSKQNSNELEGLYTAVTTLVTSISSGTTLDSFNEKVNIAIVERSKIRANDYGEADKKFVEDLLNIIISAEDFKFVRNLRKNSSGRDEIIVNPGDEHFKIATKYGLSPDNFIVWGLYFRQQPVLNAISEAIEKNYEIAIQKKKLRYEPGYSFEQKKTDLKQSLRLAFEKDPFKDGIKDFKTTLWKAQAELIVFCDSELDFCQNNIKGLDLIRSLFNNTNDVVTVWYLAKGELGRKIIHSRELKQITQKYQFTGPYTTGLLGVQTVQSEILTTHVMNYLKKSILLE